MAVSEKSIAWVLLAAGSSTRFGGSRSKLFEEIDGNRVIDLTVRSLRAALPGARLILVSDEAFRRDSGYTGEWTRGGALRQESARAGIRAAKGAGIVMVHDAARPFVSPELVRRLLNSAELHDAVAPALEVTDTIKRVRSGRVVETVAREGLYRLQTPQAIRYDVALSAFDRMEDGVEYTDDLAVIEAAGGETFVVEGDVDNLKITTAGDIVALREILRRREDRRAS